MKIHRRGQRKGLTIIEYTLLIVAVVGALTAMALPLRRAISYKWRQTADSFGGGRQYASEGERATQIIEN